MRLPLVTVIVPARDEADDIEGCLHQMGAQDYPVNRLEVIVVDGASTDGTATVAADALKRHGFASSEVVTNETGTTPSNLNVGLGRAHGEVVVRVDARSRIERHHVRTCVEVLGSRPDVAVVGGSQLAMARDARAVSVGIARALNNRWSMGFARYRRRATSGPADTVYLGAFRTDQLRAAEGWDERLLSNQDYDLNRRMSASGAVWFESSLTTGYLPRPDLLALWSQYVRFGRAKIRYWRLTEDRPQRRQVALVVAPPLAVIGAASALIVSEQPFPATVLLVSVSVLALAAVDAVGSSGPNATRLADRVHSVLAATAVGSGWWFGVAREFLKRYGSRSGLVDHVVN